MEPLQEAILALSKKGYCCSQILAHLILSAQGKENPELVRALSGLCHGIGQSGNACGILTGGCCVLAYLVGWKSEDDNELPGAKIVQAEYVDWFEEFTTTKWGSINCTAILGETTPDKSHCHELLAQAWMRLLGILAVHKISYAAPQK